MNRTLESDEYLKNRYVRSRTGFPSDKNPSVVGRGNVFYVKALCSMDGSDANIVDV